MKYLKTKEGSLEEAISQAINEKKLDPVGKEDGDIDNDGDKDDSDKYLAKKRDAINKAVKETAMGMTKPTKRLKDVNNIVTPTNSIGYYKNKK